MSWFQKVLVIAHLVLSYKPQQLKVNTFLPGSYLVTHKLMPRNPHLQHSPRAFLRFLSDIHWTFPGSEKLAHLWGNYTQWFVVLIDLVAQFLGAQTVWSDFSAPPVRCGPWRYLLTFLTSSHSCFLEECSGFLGIFMKQ